MTTKLALFIAMCLALLVAVAVAQLVGCARPYTLDPIEFPSEVYVFPAHCTVTAHGDPIQCVRTLPGGEEEVLFTDQAVLEFGAVGCSLRPKTTMPEE